MHKYLNTTFIVGAALTLSACGSTEPLVSRVLTGPDALYLGTTSTTDSANGLPFATDMPSDGDFDNPATVRLVRFVSDNVTGETTIQITEETFLIDITAPETEGFNGTITYNGETLTVVDGQATLANGQTLYSYINTGENFSGTIALYTYAYKDTDGPGINSEGFFAIGAETNPAQLREFGNVEYSGDVSGYGTVLDGSGQVVENEVSIFGTVFIDVDFDENSVNGFMDFSVNGLMGFDVSSEGEMTSLTAQLDLTQGDLIGNGFATDANNVIACPEFSTCTSNTQIGGALFGPDGEELSGVTGIDYSEFGEDGDNAHLIGAAGFTLTSGGGA